MASTIALALGVLAFQLLAAAVLVTAVAALAGRLPSFDHPENHRVIHVGHDFSYICPTAACHL